MTDLLLHCSLPFFNHRKNARSWREFGYNDKVVMVSSPLTYIARDQESVCVYVCVCGIGSV